jgi:PAS domain S-box-containing protein
VTFLGQQMGFDRVGYSEIIDDVTVRLTRCYAASGMEALSGDFPLESFGEARIARQRQGLTEVCDNVLIDPGQDADVWAAIDTRSVVSVPLVRHGRFVASLYVNNREPRRWTREDVALIEEVAGRTWDAVERARAEAALRESEARFRLMADASPQIMWVTDAEGRVEFFNTQWFDYTGAPHEPTTAAEVGSTYVHPDDEAETEAAFAEARRTGTTFHVEHRIRSASGEYRWFLVRGEPYRDPRTGEVIRWYGASVDIQDRREAEERLRASEARLRLALQAGQLAEVTFHIDGDAVSHSAAFAELLGHPSDKRLTLAEFRAQYHPEDRDRVLAERRAILESGQSFYEIEKRIVRPDGAVRWVYGRGSVNRDPQGRATSVTAVYLDDTERKQTEMALRESEERFRAIVDTATDYAIFTTDPEGRIETWPPGAQAVFGWSAREAVGQPDSLIFTPEDRARGLPEQERQGAQESGQSPNVRWHLRRDGSRVFIEGITRPLRGEDGALTGFVKVGQDVSERQAIETALRESESRFRNMADHAPVMMWVTDASGLCTYLNRAWYAFTGQTPGEARAWAGSRPRTPTTRPRPSACSWRPTRGASPFAWSTACAAMTASTGGPSTRPRPASAPVASSAATSVRWSTSTSASSARRSWSDASPRPWPSARTRRSSFVSRRSSRRWAASRAAWRTTSTTS